MNGSQSSGPGGRGRPIADSATQLLDDVDASNLARLAEMYDAVDRVPDGLVDRIKFGLALEEVFAEVAQVSRLADDAMAVRGESTSATRTETMTFSAEALTAMVTLTRVGRDRLRLDGWIAPGATMSVRLRMQGERRQTVSDETGRFSFDNLPDGFAQLSFHPTAPDRSDASVVTPLFEL